MTSLEIGVIQICLFSFKIPKYAQTFQIRGNMQKICGARTRIFICMRPKVSNETVEKNPYLSGVE